MANAVKHEAILEEKAYAESIGAFEIKNGIKFYKIRGSTDTAWTRKPSSKKGGFSSLAGYSTIIGEHSGKVLASSIKKLYCHECLPFLVNGIVDKSNKDYKEHACNRNFEGSPGSMEPTMVVEMLTDLYQNENIVVQELIGDGDSATISQVLKANIYRDLQIIVKKVECYLHAIRNFVNKSKEIEASSRLLKGTKYADKVQAVVRGTINKWNEKLNDGTPKEVAIRKLESELLQAPFHVLGRHANCTESCSKKNGNKEPEIKVEPETEIKIVTHITRLASMSPSLVLKKTTNANENFNSVQSTFQGDKRIFYAGSTSCDTR